MIANFKTRLFCARYRRASHWVMMFCILQLIGCAAMTKYEPLEPFSVKDENLSLLNNWHLKARISLLSNQSIYPAGLIWHQQKSKSKVDLTGVFGQSVYQIRLNGGIFQSSVPKTDLTQIELFDRIPIHLLNEWLKGYHPNKIIQDFTLDRKGRLSSINVGEFKISYPQYQTVKNYVLPRKIVINHKQFKLTIGGIRWQL